LVDNIVLSIAIDSTGNKWFGTSEGISRFDGTDWTTYTTDDGLVCNFVNSIAIDSDGNIWFGTNHGVSSLDGVNWTVYDKSDGLANDEVSSIAFIPPLNKSINMFTGSGYTQVCPKLPSVLYVSLRYQVVGTRPLSGADYPATRGNPLL